MDPLDHWLPTFDVRERHSREMPVEPARALAAMLGIPVGCDRLTRVLLAMRGLHRVNVPIGRFFEEAGFSVLERTAVALVLGASGRPWRPAGELAPFDEAGPGAVRIAIDFRAEPALRGSVLLTETRVAATDPGSRRAFRRYWRLVGPFSALIRRRWLAAAARRALSGPGPGPLRT